MATVKTDSYHRDRIANGLFAEWTIGDHYRQHGFQVEGFNGKWYPPDDAPDIDGTIQGIQVDAKHIPDKTLRNVSVSATAAAKYMNMGDLIIVAWCQDWADGLPRYAEWSTLTAKGLPELHTGTDNGSGQDFYLFNLARFKKCAQCRPAS